MLDAPICRWLGLSEKQYQYRIYSIGTRFKEEPGNYIFAKEKTPGEWFPCYIGQAENLNMRLGDHEKESCAKRHGATHIHAHLVCSGEDDRKKEERDLIREWKPPCNEQLRRQ